MCRWRAVDMSVASGDQQNQQHSLTTALVTPKSHFPPSGLFSPLLGPLKRVCIPKTVYANCFETCRFATSELFYSVVIGSILVFSW